MRRNHRRRTAESMDASPGERAPSRRSPMVPEVRDAECGRVSRPGQGVRVPRRLRRGTRGTQWQGSAIDFQTVGSQ